MHLSSNQSTKFLLKHKVYSNSETNTLNALLCNAHIKDSWDTLNHIQSREFFECLLNSQRMS